jgi:alpha-L-rhamnosidase
MASHLKLRWVTFIALSFSLAIDIHGAPVQLVEESPVQVTNIAPGVMLVDFGRVAFGNLLLLPPTNASGNITVDFGEAFANGRINRHPPGSVRYARVEVQLDGAKSLVVAAPANQRNTAQPAAVLTPPDWGVVLPFRWVEITGWPGRLRPEQVRRRAAFDSNWHNDAASFHSSDEMLNRIWELCRYSIKATTFAGIYVDGDRERTAYEADAYINQLGQYYTDGGVQMARDTFDRLLAHPTWPTEWAPQMIFMAHADWMQTGDTNWLASHYPALKIKLSLARERGDGLVVSTAQQVAHEDIVDWPKGERDDYVFTPVNTVVNAFHLRALALMADLARALHKDAEAAHFAARERAGRVAFQKKLFNSKLGLYRDGEGTDHASLHANLFPLAFGLVPVEQCPHVAQWLGERGMVCSVYAAQYLLEGLFENGCASNALALITAPGDRSWKHMVDSGTTITWEAWDQRYKPNLDWTHAWGAAPANLLPRFVLGVQPLAPGWKRILLRPEPGSLQSCSGKVPTPRGPVLVNWSRGNSFRLAFALPGKIPVRIELPTAKTSSVWLDGKEVASVRLGNSLVIEGEWDGNHVAEVR